MKTSCRPLLENFMEYTSQSAEYFCVYNQADVSPACCGYEAWNLVLDCLNSTIVVVHGSFVENTIRDYYILFLFW